MISMQDDPQAETPLGDLLPLRVKAVLERNGIHTVEGVRQAYPHTLLKMWGMGMFRFGEIEKALFPGNSFTPKRVYSPVRHVEGSSLNGPLSPGTVLVLSRAGIYTAEQLIAIDPNELTEIRGLGVHKLREIERAFFSGRTSTTQPADSTNGKASPLCLSSAREGLVSQPVQNPMMQNSAASTMLRVIDPHEIPLGDLLTAQVKSALERNGIHTVEGVRRAYPQALIEMRGIGILRLRKIEAALFPGKSFTPTRRTTSRQTIKGTSLNGALFPGTVQILARGGITTEEQLIAASPNDLLKIKGLGAVKLQEIESLFFADHAETSLPGKLKGKLNNSEER